MEESVPAVVLLVRRSSTALRGIVDRVMAAVRAGGPVKAVAPAVIVRRGPALNRTGPATRLSLPKANPTLEAHPARSGRDRLSQSH